MVDPIFNNWLSENFAEAQTLAAASDILAIQAVPNEDDPASPPRRLIAQFACRTHVMQPDGQIATADQSIVGLNFPPHYLRQANAYEVVTWLAPVNIWHPNIRPPACCVGERFFKPGTSLIELLYQLHAIISFQRYGAAAPLNESAAQWTRSHRQLLPADPRPLKRRAIQIQITLNDHHTEVKS
jgi:hypothetical protein